jgi:hypothetical protein
MKKFLKTLWLVVKEPFRMVNNFMFDDDAHHIVSKRVREILEKK